MSLQIENQLGNQAEITARANRLIGDVVVEDLSAPAFNGDVSHNWWGCNALDCLMLPVRF